MRDYRHDDLFCAVCSGNFEKTRELIIRDGLPKPPKWYDGYDLLCEAIQKKHTNVAKLLLDFGCSVNRPHTSDLFVQIYRGKFGTPLRLAISNDDAEIAEILLDRNVDRACVKVDLGRFLLEPENHVDRIFSNGLSLLHIAADHGNTTTVKLLLNHGAFVNVATVSTLNRGYTPLHCATAKGHDEMVKLLLDNGADVNARTNKNSTPLHIAAETRSDKIVKILLEHEGVDIDARDENGKNVLNIAIEQGNLPTLKVILEVRPDVRNENNRHCLRDAFHRTNYSAIVEILLSHGFTVYPEDARDKKLLHDVIKNKCTKVLEILLEYGADVNSLDAGRTPLHNAVIRRQLDAAELLIKYGADVNAADVIEMSPVSYAIKNTDAKMTTFLISNGAIVKYSYELLCPVKKGAREMMEIMMNHDANFDIDARNEKGLTPLNRIIKLRKVYECYYDNCDFDIDLDLVELLLSRGADVNATTANNKSPLYNAVEDNYDDFVEVLLKFEADVNIATTEDMNTPLHCSARRGNEKITRMLLDAGASISAKNKYGETALHCACECDGDKVVAALLEFDAAIDDRNNEGSSPLHIAVTYDSLKIVELMLRSLANVELKDKDGRTALHVASVFGRSKIAAELLNYGADMNVTCNKGHSPMDDSTRYCPENCRELNRFFDHPRRYKRDRDDNDTRMRAYRSNCYDDTANIMRRHIVKLKLLDATAIKGNLDSLYRNKELRDFGISCERELTLLKNEKIAHTNISYYDVFIKSMNQLSMLARNKSIADVLESSSCDERFPKYRKMLYYKFKRAEKRRDLLSSGWRSIKCITGFALPEYVALELLCYLNDKELDNLIEASEENDGT